MLKQLLTASPVSLDALNRAMPQTSASDNPTSPVVIADLLEPRSPSGLLTIAEVAALLQMSEKSVQRRIKNGVIRKAPTGGRLVRISSDEVRRLTSGLRFCQRSCHHVYWHER